MGTGGDHFASLSTVLMQTLLELPSSLAPSHVYTHSDPMWFAIVHMLLRFGVSPIKSGHLIVASKQVVTLVLLLRSSDANVFDVNTS